MIVQFILENVLSFKEETVFDMSAISAYKEHEYNLIDRGKEKFLKVASIYGANASGKSNFHQAWIFFQKIIKESFNNPSESVDGDEKLAIQKYYVPFGFSEEKKNSQFQIIFNKDNYEYQYGFEYNDTRIVSEWLYRKSESTNRNTTIFERENDSVFFGYSIRKECEKFKDQIPQTALLLSFFNKLVLKTDVFNTVYLAAAYDTLVIDSDGLENSNFLYKLLPDILKSEKKKNKLLSFLISIDTGIKDVYLEENDKDIIFYTKHLGENDHEYKLNLFNESEGTLKSLVIYLFADLAIMNNKSLFIDEMNTKLHPLLLKFIVDLFYEQDSTAQLIYTTHDTTLMDKRFFRRDQIWFVQKDSIGHSQLVSLADFKVRSDSSFEKDYLAGVYGGIPFLKEFSLKEGN